VPYTTENDVLEIWGFFSRLSPASSYFLHDSCTRVSFTSLDPIWYGSCKLFLSGNTRIPGKGIVVLESIQKIHTGQFMDSKIHFSDYTRKKGKTSISLKKIGCSNGRNHRQQKRDLSALCHYVILAFIFGLYHVEFQYLGFYFGVLLISWSGMM
jgi:hypothetical protein